MKELFLIVKVLSSGQSRIAHRFIFLQESRYSSILFFKYKTLHVRY